MDLANARHCRTVLEGCEDRQYCPTGELGQWAVLRRKLKVNQVPGGLLSEIDMSVKSVRSIAGLVVGNSLPSITALITLPILARLYPPDAVGYWALFQSVLFVPLVLSTFRYELAVIVEKDEQDAGDVVVLVVVSSSVVGLSGLLVLVILESLGFFPIAGAFTFLAATCLVLSSIFGSLQSVGIALASRHRFYTGISYSRLSQAMVTAVVPLALAHWWPTSDSLILGTTLGLVAGVLFLSRSIWASTSRFVAAGRGRKNLLAALRRNRAFALFTVPYTFVTQALGLLITSLIAATHGPYVLGQYSLMYRTVTAPASIVIGSLGQYTARPLVHFSDNRADAVEPISGLVSILLACFIPLGTFISLNAEEVFAFLFGTKWRMAGRFAELAIVPMCVLMSVGWIDRLFDAWREQRLGLAVGSAGCVCWLAVVVAAQQIWNEPMTTIAGWSLGLLINAMIWAAGMNRLAQWPAKRRLFTLSIAVLAFAPVLIVHEIVQDMGTVLQAAMLVSTVGVVYVVLALVIRSSRLQLRPLLGE